ncbi:MAG: CBS domain-containing protein [Minicystis sp.]
MVLASMVSLTAIGIAAVALASDRGDAAKYVFASVVPLFGSWIGTVLAYYFAKDNLAAATSSVATLARGALDFGRLRSLAVKDKMMDRSRIVTLPDTMAKPLGKLDAVPLKDIIDFLAARGVNRIPILDDAGAIRYLIHLSSIDRFIREQVLAGKDAAALTFKDLVSDPMLAKLFTGSFDVVAETATLADAKARMDEKPQCEDVFVTKSGDRSAPVIGWVTDSLLFEAAQV